MRANMTEPEKRMWYGCLRQLPYRFRRQRPFGPFIVDFYCAELKLVIEIDGDSHSTPEACIYDTERTAFLESQGLHVVRFSNEQVMTNMSGIFEFMQNVLLPKHRPPSVPPIS